MDQLYRHMANDIQHITPINLPEESTGGTASDLDTVFSYRSLCNGYWIAYTSRIRDLLLLFLLVSTCQISTPTLTTRYHAIYNCGWWCRDSTHLQMWHGKAQQPTRPCENHGLHTEHIPTWMERWYKQQMQSLVVPAQGSLAIISKMQRTQKCM